jgi:sensor histidine kinase YesM
LLLIAGVVVVVFMLYRNQLKKLREKFTIEQTQASLHLTALRAQMNPHFIFNIMNSIRQYMQNNNSASAEKYLSSFAKHLRNTLDNSEVQEISLGEEVDALKIYAELEMQGIENGFEFEVQCDKEIDLSETMLPSLLLQPFVENAIKHGIHGMNGEGKINVRLKQINNSIFIIIEDNGIGREEAFKLKLHKEEKHISHGTRMAFDRIEAYNKAYSKKIKATIVDLTESNGKPIGTRVEIQI